MINSVLTILKNVTSHNLEFNLKFLYFICFHPLTFKTLCAVIRHP